MKLLKHRAHRDEWSTQLKANKETVLRVLCGSIDINVALRRLPYGPCTTRKKHKTFTDPCS